MHTVPITSRATDALDRLLDPADRRGIDQALDRQRRLLAGRRLWHVNSTAIGGGVAEMLAALLPYGAGAGIDVSWLVVEGDPGFFEVTKRLHNRLHDEPGDGGPLGPAERRCYDRTLARHHGELLRAVRPGDVAVLHDPQTAGLVPVLQSHGTHVIWRCHIGTETPGDLAPTAWAFLADDVDAADVAIFTRPQYVWDGLAPEGTVTMPPCIDVGAPKNQPLPDGAVAAILNAAGLVPAGAAIDVPPAYVDADGSTRRVRRRSALTEVSPVPADARLVTQVSRWDRLKDPVGLIDAFVDHGPPEPDVHLLLVGPMDGVADDPESSEVFAEVSSRWSALPTRDRGRVHLARVPMDDPAENAAIVNAVQRRSAVVVQKSLAEGFGLTVSEAMWKARPVVASRVGGIQDQVVHGESGLLVDDPTDLTSVGAALRTVLADRALADRLGAAARATVCDQFLPVQQFAAEADMFERLLVGSSGAALAG